MLILPDDFFFALVAVAMIVVPPEGMRGEDGWFSRPTRALGNGARLSTAQDRPCGSGESNSRAQQGRAAQVIVSITIAASCRGIAGICQNDRIRQRVPRCEIAIAW